MAEIFAEEMSAILEWLSRQVGFEVLEVNYRDCLQSAPAVAASISCFLGGALNEQGMAAAVDSSLYRIRS